jgi:enamine deaminase RidA (YjgF/YER057c/UK114 family)
MKKEVILPDEQRRKRQYYPRANKVGNWLFLSGVVALDDYGKTVGPTIEEQAIRVFDEIKNILESLGSSMENIVRMITFMVNIDDFGKVKEIRERYIPQDKNPAATAVEVTSLVKSFMNEGQVVKHDPPLLIEVECTAIVPDE